MRLKLLACKVLSREVGLLSPECPNFLDITYLRQGYHDTPDLLRTIIQSEIDKIDEGNCPYTSNTEMNDLDAILLGYGVCSNGVFGVSSKKYKIVIPRAHDCITLFLGSKERYKELFDKNPGTYWFTPGWIENTIMPSADYKERYHAYYTEKYGEENADYLAEETANWLKNYNKFAYVDWGFCPECKAFCQNAAKAYHFEYECFEGDKSLLKDFLWGNWDSNKFLVLEPNQTATGTTDESIMKVE